MPVQICKDRIRPSTSERSALVYDANAERGALTSSAERIVERPWRRFRSDLDLWAQGSDGNSFDQNIQLEMEPAHGTINRNLDVNR
jgi:hypothetical protein